MGQCVSFFRGVFRAGVVAGAFLTTSMLAAQALPASCQTEFGQLSTDRQKILDRINAFNKKRPTATSACTTFNQLNAMDEKMLEWMASNKEWCQLGDEILQQFEAGKAQANSVRDQACTMAKKEQEMLSRARAQQGSQGGASTPGSGVQLPKGAL
jgi:hypothetical protein